LFLRSITPTTLDRERFGRLERPPVSAIVTGLRRRKKRYQHHQNVYGFTANPSLMGSLAPTSIIWGTADGIVSSAYAHDLAQRIAKARIELIDDAGHLPPLEQPRKVAQIVSRFLRD